VSNLQIKNVPEDLHAELRRRADGRGQTLRDYVLDLLRREVNRPDLDEWLDRVASDPPVTLDVSAVDLVHEARAEREANLDRVLRGR
jgi:plasmid stability protein